MANRFNNTKKRCPFVCLSFILSFLAPLFFTFNVYAQSKIAFYYGDNPPLTELRWFDNVIIDPSSNFNPKFYNTNQSKAFAYLSLGEIPTDQLDTKKIPNSWILGKNTIWQSSVIDQTNPAWQKYVVENLVANLWNQGYQGFFLDTLDSYQLVTKDAAAKRQIDGLITIIKMIKQKYPNAKIILNRGFELLPQIHDLVYAVAAESLFRGWDQKNKQYVSINNEERTQLLNQLNQVKKLGIPVISIEYLPSDQTTQAQDIAANITQLGFIPWMTNSDLTNIDYMLPAIIPRKILVIADTNIPHYIFDYDALTNLAMPLQYLGYVPEIRDIEQPLPDVSTKTYAGIAVWLDRDHPTRQEQFYRWLISNKNKHIPIVFFNHFGFGLQGNKLAPFGLAINDDVRNTHWLKTTYKAPGIGYEIQPFVKPEDFVSIRITNGKPLLSFEDAVGTKGDMVGIMPWGGYALYPCTILDVTKDESKWVINPFTFLKQALRLPNIPIPDTTTENGRRIMFVHIDGDGIANKGEWLHGPYSGKVLLTDIFLHYRVPTSVSIIQGEVATNGMYPKDSKELEEISREIFRLPWVEIASHTFSHPYNWQPQMVDPEIPKNTKFEAFNLKIPNYRYDLKTEIIGSVDYINKTLAPAGKKCKILFWSGDANPPAEALALTYQIGIKNLNGGDSDISNYNDSVTHVGPIGISQNSYFQTFAPIQNDYIYTKEWTAPFYQYVTVIDAFKLTESPLRLKPIDIYYHMYAGSKLASLNALKQVYDWSLAQPVINFYASEYIDKVADFNEAAIAQKDNGWLIRTSGNLRELRIPKSAGYPDLENSKNLIGYNEHGDDYYLHLGPATESFIKLGEKPYSLPYLLSANAVITKFERGNNQLNFTLAGYLPLKLSLANMNNCWMESNGKRIDPNSVSNGEANYDLPTEIEHAFTIKCK